MELGLQPAVVEHHLAEVRRLGLVEALKLGGGGGGGEGELGLHLVNALLRLWQWWWWRGGGGVVVVAVLMVATVAAAEL